MIRKIATHLAGRGRRRAAFAGDERGATAVEFALLAFPFFTIIAGILQTSMVLLTGQVLESAVNDASRVIRTGQIRDQGNSLATFRTELCDRLYGLVNSCDGLHIRVTEITDFTSASVTVPIDTSCQNTCDWNAGQSWTPGAGKSIMLVQVYFKYPVFVQLGPFGMANLGDGTRLMGAATVFQNEPYT